MSGVQVEARVLATMEVAQGADARAMSRSSRWDAEWALQELVGTCCPAYPTMSPSMSSRTEGVVPLLDSDGARVPSPTKALKVTIDEPEIYYSMAFFKAI